jgi:hypothetical protein
MVDSKVHRMPFMPVVSPTWLASAPVAAATCSLSWPTVVAPGSTVTQARTPWLLYTCSWRDTALGGVGREEGPGRGLKKGTTDGSAAAVSLAERQRACLVAFADTCKEQKVLYSV